MSRARPTDGMTVEEFLAWNLSQDERFELVDGVPVPLRAMAGAAAEHDAIVVNLIGNLFNQLRGTPCKARTADTAVRTKINNVRRPDVTIECAPLERRSLEARNPVAVFEILSPTTKKIDRSVKLQEYRRHPNLRVIVHLDPDLMDVIVFTRDSTGDWNDVRLDQAEDRIVVPDLPVSLRLADLYDGVPLDPPPES
jgi:Uma2 family endonuclease